MTRTSATALRASAIGLVVAAALSAAGSPASAAPLPASGTAAITVPYCVANGGDARREGPGLLRCIGGVFTGARLG